MKKKLIAFMALATVCCHAQQNIRIIPQPAAMEQPKAGGNFTISPATPIVVKGSALEPSVGFLNDYLQRYYHFGLKTAKDPATKNAIVLQQTEKNDARPGAYTLTVSHTSITISAGSDTGVFYGIQTLLQLLPVSDPAASQQAARLSVPQVTIKDYPRFAYRGLMLDAGRHFFPVSFIKQYIDYIALHKMNYFHWHLTEDQGWRIEIKKYPRLTETGAFRNGTIVGHYPGKENDNERYGGFYTQEQVKEIVRYAADRYITIIPEIELPGHSSAAIAAYPQLSCFPDSATVIPQNKISAGGKAQQAAGHPKIVQESWGVYKDVYCPSEYTFSFLQDVIDEIIPLFPAPYIHIGGDECPKESWKTSAFCQNLIKEKGLKDEHGLQSYFISRMEKYINSKGKNIIGWDEILEGGLAPNATVMSWRGEKGGIEAAQQNHNVIMSPTTYVYFDYSQNRQEDSLVIGGFLPLEKVYGYEPIPAVLSTEQARHVLGGQANVWTEYMSNDKKVEYMIFPRLSALSEVLWSPKEKKNYAGFLERMQEQVKRYRLWGSHYGKI